MYKDFESDWRYEDGNMLRVILTQFLYGVLPILCSELGVS